MINQLQCTINISMEAVMIVILGFLLFSCHKQRREFLTIAPLMFLTVVVIMILIVQILTWIIILFDINIKGITSLELAVKLQEYNPRINIIFCTGYSEYSLDALDLYCSAYLLKPVTDEKIRKALEKLRYPLSNKIENFKVKCFGNFEVYKDGYPIKFRNKKTKELFAYLIDRKGATVSTREIMTALYEDDDKESYIRNLRADLSNTLENLDLERVLIKNGGNVGVNAEIIDCDYYDYLNGNKNCLKENICHNMLLVKLLCHGLKTNSAGI